MAPLSSNASHSMADDECTTMQAYDSIDYNIERLSMHQLGWGICTSAAIIATIISFAAIYRHAINYNKATFYFEGIGDVYESILMGSFFMLLCNYLADDLPVNTVSSETDTPTQSFFSKLCLHPSSSKFINTTKIMVLQYVAIKPLTMIVASFTHHFNMLCPGSLSPQYANLWANIINGVSMLVAMQGLLSIYYAISSKIRVYNPNVQFLSVKLAVFLVTIQKLLLAILVHFNVFRRTNHWSAVDIARGVNAIAINVELIAFALLHLYAFDHHRYISHTTNICPISSKIEKLRLRTPSWRIFRDALNPWEILRELCHAIVAIFYNNMGENYPTTMKGKI
ncbi:organic solute transporter Ostalpha-domain-containing protein [Syncephalis plumigaleata]|nr:organic solute transporter Ostalpha-domain-containing protein [Syncephalis plumigaleata]